MKEAVLDSWLAGAIKRRHNLAVFFLMVEWKVKEKLKRGNKGNE